MHRLPARALLLGVMLAAASNDAAATAVPHLPSDDAIRALVQPYVDGGEAKGIVVGLLEPDGTRRVVASGEAGEGARPLGSRSVFEIGSITKTFTGTVLADMVRRGEVGLDDPVARYLPAGVRVPAFNGRQITLRDLATHTSGLPRMPSADAQGEPADPGRFGAGDLLAFLEGHQLDREPGTAFGYSNLGMGLLGHALARAAGEDDFQSLVARRVLQPLGMSMTGYGRDGAIGTWMTIGHDAQGGIAPYFDVAVLAGGGGLNSNVEDLLTYLDAHVGEPGSPLELAMRDAVRAYHAPRPEVDVGLGWMTRKRGPDVIVGHNGDTAGFSTFIAFDPATRTGVVVLANSGGFGAADKIGRDLLGFGRRADPSPGSKP